MIDTYIHVIFLNGKGNKNHQPHVSGCLLHECRED